MKQKDMVVIIAVAFVAGIFSVVLSNMLFSGDKTDLVAEKADPISSEFNGKPDETVFNGAAVNPTQLIQISENNKQNLF